MPPPEALIRLRRHLGAGNRHAAWGTFAASLPEVPLAPEERADLRRRIARHLTETEAVEGWLRHPVTRQVTPRPHPSTPQRVRAGSRAPTPCPLDGLPVVKTRHLTYADACRHFFWLRQAKGRKHRWQRDATPEQRRAAMAPAWAAWRRVTATARLNRLPERTRAHLVQTLGLEGALAYVRTLKPPSQAPQLYPGSA